MSSVASLAIRAAVWLRPRVCTCGTVIQRTELKAAPGWEAILVQRILPPAAESGKHTQSGNEIVFIQEGEERARSVAARNSPQEAR
ncbi:MAG: hypothetical protein WBP52_09590 [Terriglobales bacterium]